MLTRRQLAALIALAGLMLAIYLTLHNLGYIGTLTCTIGSCETVQTSRWSRFLGIPVAAWGAGFYLTVLVLALLGESPRYARAPWVPKAMLALTGFGVLFSGWLTWLEIAVIVAICIYCVTSALLTLALFGIAFVDHRAVAVESPEG